MASAFPWTSTKACTLPYISSWLHGLMYCTAQRSCKNFPCLTSLVPIQCGAERAGCGMCSTPAMNFIRRRHLGQCHCHARPTPSVYKGKRTLRGMPTHRAGRPNQAAVEKLAKHWARCVGRKLHYFGPTELPLFAQDVSGSSLVAGHVPTHPFLDANPNPDPTFTQTLNLACGRVGRSCIHHWNIIFTTWTCIQRLASAKTNFERIAVLFSCSRGVNLFSG